MMASSDFPGLLKRATELLLRDTTTRMAMESVEATMNLALRGVPGAPGGVGRYAVTLRRGRVEIREGQSPEAIVSMETDLETQLQMYEGASPMELAARGKLTVSLGAKGIGDASRFAPLMVAYRRLMEYPEMREAVREFRRAHRIPRPSLLEDVSVVQRALELPAGKAALPKFASEPLECMKRPELEALQAHKLREQMTYVWEKSPFYRRKFKEAGVGPGDIKSVADLARIPPTTKEEIRATQEARPPFGELLCVPEENIRAVFASSGTTGVPVLFASSPDDLEGQFASIRNLWMLGLKPGAVLQNSMSTSMFIGGSMIASLAAGSGPRAGTGMTFLQAGTGDSERQLRFMRRFRTNVWMATPSYTLYLAEVARRSGFKPEEFAMELVLVGGEPGPNAVPGLRERIEEAWNARCLEFYSTTEMGALLFSECEETCGLHAWEDGCVIEVVDPETGEAVADGERGNLVFTHLGMRTMPLVRWWSGDVTRVERDACACGRTHMRLMGITGRTDDMTKVRGVKFLPSSVEGLVRSVPGLNGEFLITVDKEGGLDRLRLQVEAAPGQDPAAAARKLREEFRANFVFDPEIEVLPEGTLPRFVHKSVRLVDLRKEGSREKFERITALQRRYEG